MTHQMNHRIARSAGLLLAVAAVAAPGAYADGPTIVQSPDSVDRNLQVKAAPAAAAVVQSPDSVDRNATARQGQVIDLVSPDARDAATARPVVQVPPVVEQVTASDGMDWGDAAIGAGGAIGLLLLAAGGAMAVSRRHGHGHGHTA